MSLTLDEVLRNPPKFSRLSVYTNPFIPKKKLDNAIASYGDDSIYPEDVLLLVDDTLFGSAKEGFFLTREYFHITGGYWGHLSSIKDIYQKVTLTVPYMIIEDVKEDQGDWECSFTSASKQDVHLLINYLLTLIQIIRDEDIEAEKQREAELEFQKQQDEEYQRQLLLQEKEAEERRKEEERIRQIDSAYEDTSDEILSRVNKVFTIISEIEKSVGYVILCSSFIKAKIISREMYETIIEKPEMIAYYAVELTSHYSELKSEYDKMRAISEIIEKNKEIIIERLDIIDEYVIKYKKLVEVVWNIASEIYQKDLSESIIDDSDAMIDLISSKLEIKEDEIYVYPTLPTERQREQARIYEKDNDEIGDGESTSSNKASSILSSFLTNNSEGVMSKLKNSGLSLTSAALQNDENISKVANVVYNLLPGAIRIFVSFSTVENFLLENRHWLINKLN